MSVEDRASSTGAIRGWGCTPTGDPPPAAVSQDARPRTTCLPDSLVKGWRRTCLYSIILFLMVLVFLNIALTLWIIGTLRLNANGIGPIKIVKNGIQLEGQTWVADRLVAASIASQPAQPVTIHSHRNFTVLVSGPASARNDSSPRVELAKLFIKRDSVVCSGRKLEVRDSHDKIVFAASRDEVRTAAEVLAVEGAGGVTVRGAVQTPSVRAPPGSDLQLESLTRKLTLRAPHSIQFESRAGNIDVTSHGDIKFDSVVGAIKIDSPNVVINNLKEAIVTDKPQKNIRTMRVYQLCACATGKLFLASPDGACVATDDELCR